MTFLNENQIDTFNKQGYLVVENVFNPETVLDPLIKEYKMVLDSLANDLYDKGLIRSKYKDDNFSERLIKISEESGKIHAQYFDFSLPQNGIKIDTPRWHGPAVFDVLSNPDILDTVEKIIGPEIYSNPIQHVRLKPPEKRTPVHAGTKTVQSGATPWHQDNGVANQDADDTNMLTVWIPIWDATVTDGCLHVVPESHIEGLKTHCPQSILKDARGGFGLHIPDKLFRVNDAIPIPMKRGSILLLNKMTCHGSLPNKSNRIRWSLDLRYNPIGEPTGRDAFPGFVARSKKNPSSELHDPVAWAKSWIKARHNLSIGEEQSYNRWDSNDPSCA